MRRTCLILALVPAALLAQNQTGRITGSVVDQTGAVLVNAKVTAADQDTGVAYSGVTSSTGMYVIPFLPPGRYLVGLSLPGFKSYARPGVVVSTGEAVPLDIQLELGTAAESVTVRDAPPVLESGAAQR